MARIPVDVAPAACRQLLLEESVGRVALCTSSGPHIVPVNYAVVDDAIVLRTSPYSALGLVAPGSLIAFEVDRLDPATRSGWSVLVSGRCEVIEDAAMLSLVTTFADPDPWAGGSRHLHLRLPWGSISGRRLGDT